MAFLRRNLASYPKDVKAQCYKNLVIPILEFAASVCDQHITKCIQQLEAVQRRAAWFVKVTIVQLVAPPRWCRTSTGKHSSRTRRRQTSDGVPHHIRSGGHPCFQVLSPNNVKHQRQLPSISDTLLYNRRPRALLLPLGNQTLEPTIRVHRHVRDPWWLQEGSRKSTLTELCTFFFIYTDFNKHYFTVTCLHLTTALYIYVVQVR